LWKDQLLSMQGEKKRTFHAQPGADSIFVVFVCALSFFPAPLPLRVFSLPNARVIIRMQSSKHFEQTNETAKNKNNRT
jgi:hypothetical protein